MYSAKDPISWIEDFKRETLETIGYLGRDHSGELFKKEESFRFEQSYFGDCEQLSVKIINENEIQIQDDETNRKIKGGF